MLRGFLLFKVGIILGMCAEAVAQMCYVLCNEEKLGYYRLKRKNLSSVLVTELLISKLFNSKII